MATSNFHNVNATHIFACSLENEWDYEDLVDNLTYEFKTHADWYDGNKSDPHECRSFPSRVLGSLTKDFSYNDFSLEVWVSPVIRSGYYEGVNLDWNAHYFINGNECDLDDIDRMLEYDTDYSPSKRKAYSLLVEKKAEKLRDELVEVTENIFEQYSDKLGVTARFSNGETIYHKVA
jgi:hypothetical protein